MKFKFLNKKKLVVILLSSIAITNFTACNKEDYKVDVTINIEDYNDFTTNNSENQVINNVTNITQEDNSYENKTQDNHEINNTENKTQDNHEINNNENKTTEVKNGKLNITKEDIQNEIMEIIEDDKKFLNDIKNFITQSYSDNDEVIIKEFEKIKNEINEIQEDDKDFLNDMKLNFITCIDFVFYGTEINGVKFEDLTQKGKQKTLELISSIDSSIENKFPNYKSEISNGTNNILNKISDLIKQGAVNIDNFTKTKLTEEEYNNLNKAKNDVIEFGKGAFENIKDASGELYNEGKQKVKELYNDFKK